MRKGAKFGEGRTHRYVLWRLWNEKGERKKFITFIGLNPSIANATHDDNTIKRLIHFTRTWGYNGFYIVNLFSVIATKSKLLKSLPEVNTYESDYYILKAARKSSIVCLMYGNNGILFDRDKYVLNVLLEGKLLRKTVCFGITKLGHPKHPLYLPNDNCFYSWLD